MATSDTEILFAQRLASNEGKVRGRAIKNLRKYLEIKSKSKKGFEEEDFLKLFKGLHYCLWMQDKPLLQEELVSKITGLVHVIEKADLTFSFIKVFFVTEVREWPTIDRYRLDKFMSFVRKFFAQCLKYIQTNSWKSEHIEHMNDVLLETILDHNALNVSTGIQMHFNDIFLDELKKVDLSEISTDNFCLCLQPFVTFASKSKQKGRVLDVIEKVFAPLVNPGFQGIETRLVAAARHWLADKLFTCGSSTECTDWQRKQFYALVTKIRDQETKAAERMKENSNKNTGEAKKERKKKAKKSPLKNRRITRGSLRSSTIQTETEQSTKAVADSTTNVESETPKKLKRKTDPEVTSEIITSPMPKKRKKSMTPRKKLAEIKSNGESTQTPVTEQEVATSTKKKKVDMSVTPKNRLNTPLKKKAELSATPKNGKTPMEKKAKLSATPKNGKTPMEKKAKLCVTPKNRLDTPTKCGSDCKKKVVFDMQKNTALKFKKTMAVSPFPNSPSAYCPKKQPEQSILKGSPRA